MLALSAWLVEGRSEFHDGWNHFRLEVAGVNGVDLLVAAAAGAETGVA